MVKAAYIAVCSIFFLPTIVAGETAKAPAPSAGKEQAAVVAESSTETAKKPSREAAVRKERHSHRVHHSTGWREKSSSRPAPSGKSADNSELVDVERYMGARNYPEAIKKLVSMLRKDPDNHELHYRLAICYDEFGMPNKAIQELNTTVKLKVDFAPAHIRLGTILLKRDYLDAALRSFVQASEINPNDVELKYHLARLYMEKGNRDKALEEFRSILRIDPSYYMANIGVADILTDNKDYENAVEELRAASIYSRRNPEIHFRLGRIFQAQGDRTGATEEYRLLKEINPEMAHRLFVALYPESK